MDGNEWDLGGKRGEGHSQKGKGAGGGTHENVGGTLVGEKDEGKVRPASESLV